MFEIRIADNFHYTDSNESFTYGKYETWAEALAAAKGIVDKWLAEQVTIGMSAEQLLKHYRAFGDDPYIIPVPENEHFSAWKYAEEQCDSLCRDRDQI